MWMSNADLRRLFDSKNGLLVAPDDSGVASIVSLSINHTLTNNERRYIIFIASTGFALRFAAVQLSRQLNQNVSNNRPHYKFVHRHLSKYDFRDPSPLYTAPRVKQALSIESHVIAWPPGAAQPQRIKKCEIFLYK
ncbi:hypothetical protein HDU90_000189 [Geranomyces variabilis]|nr:hypothetical protein HDU90_000189 [Geranomyces variabilis]